MEGIQKGLIVYFVAISGLALLLCGADKRRARAGLWRIRESTFFCLALLGGSPGLLAGMYLFRHKTKHLSFTIGVPLILLCQCILTFMLIRR